MSPQVSNFVHDLVAMAQAMDRLPIVESEMESLRHSLHDAQAHNEGLELSIVRYKEDIETLHSRIRSLEVERDDAGFRELEAVEALDILKRDGTKAADLLNEALRLIAPPKPEPVKVEPMPEAVKIEETYPWVSQPSEPVPTPTVVIDTDPEPIDRWSEAWDAWRDRQDAKDDGPKYGSAF